MSVLRFDLIVGFIPCLRYFVSVVFLAISLNVMVSGALSL